MTPTPAANPVAPGPPSGELRVGIRAACGNLIRKTHPGAADDLVRRCLGEWMGTGKNRYVRLAERVSALPGGWRDGNKPTERAKNDAGGWIGAPVSTQEHEGAA